MTRVFIKPNLLSVQKMLVYVALALHFLMCESIIEPLSEHQISIEKSLLQCITTTSKQFFSNDFETITFSRPLLEPNNTPISLDVLTLLELSELRNAGLMVMNLNSLNGKWTKIKTMIVHFTDEEEMLHHLSMLEYNNLLNSYTKYLLVSTVIFEHPFHIATMISEYMWRKDAVNFVIMIPYPTKPIQFIVYTWNPYRDGCGSDFSRSSSYSIGYCSEGRLSSNTQWFNDKIPRKLFNCTVNAEYWVFPPYVFMNGNKLCGIEMNILELIGNQLNLTFVFDNAVEGNVSNRHDINAQLTFLKETNMDIFFGGIPRISIDHQELLTSESYMQDSFLWCVPNEPLENDLENFITVISYKVFLVSSLLHAIVSLFIWHLSTKSNSEIYFYKKFFQIYYYTYGMMSGSNIPKQPRTVKVRYVLAMFVLFCFIIDSFYNSLLTRNLTRPQFKPKYTSMKDIYDNNLNTYFVPEQRIFFKTDVYTVPLNEILRKWRDCFDHEMCMNHVYVSMNSSFCVSRLFKNFITSNHTFEDLYCLKKDQISYPVTMVMREGFLFQQRFDEIIVKLLSSGFIAKWSDDFAKEINKPLHNDTVQISLKNLLPLFQVQFLLLTIATLIFIVERLGHTIIDSLNNERIDIEFTH